MQRRAPSRGGTELKVGLIALLYHGQACRHTLAAGSCVVRLSTLPKFNLQLLHITGGSERLDFDRQREKLHPSWFAHHLPKSSSSPGEYYHYQLRILIVQLKIKVRTEHIWKLITLNTPVTHVRLGTFKCFERDNTTRDLPVASWYDRTGLQDLDTIYDDVLLIVLENQDTLINFDWCG